MSDIKSTPVTNEQSTGNNDGKKRNRNRNKNKNKAEFQFDRSAAPKTLEKFFSEIIEEERENVDIELHLDIDERLIDGYDDRLESFMELQPVAEEQQAVLTKMRIYDLQAMTNIAVAKKLWNSTPTSEKTAVESLKYLRNFEVSLPKSTNIAIDHLGKITTEEWICRIKWNALTISRFLFRAIQCAVQDVKFQKQYLADIENEEMTSFMKTDVGNLILTNNDSVAWIRDFAKSGLQTVMQHEFEVKVNQVDITVCYPQLKFHSNRDEDATAVKEWMSKLTINHPDWETAADVAICRLTELNWIENRRSTMSELDPIFAGTIWKDRVFADVLKNLGIIHISDFPSINIRNLTSNFTHHYQKMALPIFKRVFNMTESSKGSEFGSMAQLITLRGDDFTKVKKRFTNLFLTKNSIEGSSLFKVKDKSAIVQNMVYGFAKNVEVKENYKYRLNGNPNAIKATNIGNDFKE